LGSQVVQMRGVPDVAASMEFVDVFLVRGRGSADEDGLATFVEPVSWNANGFGVCDACPGREVACDYFWDG
jgi:hypothetical protein